MHPQILKARLHDVFRVMLLVSPASLTSAVFAEVQPQLNVMPMPASVQIASRQLPSIAALLSRLKARKTTWSSGPSIDSRIS